jgi:DNA topoisomerase-6 subunit B
MVHIASVWVPFTSESKEAIAHYPEIIKEIKRAVQECGRKLGMYVRRQRRIKQEMVKRDYIKIYLPHIGEALRDILALKETQVDRLVGRLKDTLEKSRKI